jgi:hypothetical protein
MQLQVPGVTRPDFWYRTVVVRVIVIQHTRDVTTPAGDGGEGMTSDHNALMGNSAAESTGARRCFLGNYMC